MIAVLLGLIAGALWIDRWIMAALRSFDKRTEANRQVWS